MGEEMPPIPARKVRVIAPEYTEWQWPLSGVHSIMMVKSALAGVVRVGGARPPPFLPSRAKVVVYAQAERADTLPYFSSTPICTLWL
jgi:hypothetical protein